MTDKTISKKKPLENCNTMDLEQVVYLTNKIGVEYANAKVDVERLDLLKPCVKARIALRIESEFSGEKMTETKLKRLTDADKEYLKFIEEFVAAKNKSEQLKIRYDSYKSLFDARRSQLSYRKAQMSLI